MELGKKSEFLFKILSVTSCQRTVLGQKWRHRISGSVRNLRASFDNSSDLEIKLWRCIMTSTQCLECFPLPERSPPRPTSSTLWISQSRDHHNWIRTDNGVMPKFLTQSYPPNSPLVDAPEVISSPLPCTRMGTSVAVRLTIKSDLEDVHFIASKNSLYDVYQDWVHQNPSTHLDGGILRIVSSKRYEKNLFVLPPNAMTYGTDE